jgi:hypothetical protein
MDYRQFKVIHLLTSAFYGIYENPQFRYPILWPGFVPTSCHMNRVARQAARSQDIAADTQSYIRTVLVGFVVDEIKQEPALLSVGTSVLTRQTTTSPVLRTNQLPAEMCQSASHSLAS